MKKLYLFLVLMQVLGSAFAQKQISNFLYPTANNSLNYRFFSTKNSKNNVWFYNESGVFSLNLQTKQIKKIMLNDSVSANAIYSYFDDSNNNSTIILKDSVSNSYFGTVDLGGLKILKTVPIQRNDNGLPTTTFHENNNLLFSDTKSIYRIKKSQIEKLSDFDNPTTIAAENNSWAAINADSIIYDGIKQSLNPFWKDKSLPKLVFHQQNLYGYTSNRIWLIRKNRSRIQADSLMSFNKLINVYKQNDTLFVEEGSKGMYGFYADKRYSIGNNKIFLQKEGIKSFFYWKWEDEIVKVSSGNYTGTIMCGLVDKRKLKNNYTTIYYQNTTNFINIELDKVKKTDSTYLFTLRSPYNKFYASLQIKKDTILYEILENIRPLNDSLVLGITKSNELKTLNLKTFQISTFLTLPATYQVYSQPYSISFTLGNNNLAFRTDYNYKLNLLENYRANRKPIFIDNKYESSSLRSFLLNDTIVTFPYKIYQNPIEVLGLKNYFIGLGRNSDTLFFYNLATKKDFFIKLNSKPISNVQVWVISKDEIVFLVDYTNLYSWKIDNLVLLKQNINANMFYILKDGLDKFLMFSREETASITEVSQISNQRIDNKYDIKIPNYYNYIFDVEFINPDLFKIKYAWDKIILLKSTKSNLEVIPPFWNGYASSFWTDKNNVIYCRAENTIYSSKKPKESLLQRSLPPNVIIGGSILIIMTNGDIIFDGTINYKGAYIKYKSSERSYYYLTTKLESSYNTSYNISRTSIFLRTYKNQEPYFFLIDENGEKQLNTKPLKGTDYLQFKNDTTYVVGSLKGGTRQIFELAPQNGIAANLEWKSFDNQTVTEVPVETKGEFGEVIAYPNPFSENINFKFNNVPGIYQVGIYDMQGKTIWFDFSGNFVNDYLQKYQNGADLFLAKTKRENLAEILEQQLVGLPAGTYLIRFYFDEFHWDKAMTIKVIKQ